MIKTWTSKGLLPKFHISQQKPDSRIGSHDHYLDSIPAIIFKLPQLFNTKIYLMIEAKQKEQAIFKLLKKYFVKKTNGRKTFYIPKVPKIKNKHS